MKKKLIVALLALSMVSTLLAGCGSSSIDSQVEVGASSEEAENVTEEENSEKKEVESNEEIETKNEESNALEKPETSPVSSDLSSDWKDMQIQIDGHVLTLPCDYSEIEALGYSVDWSQFEEEDCILEPNYYTMLTVDAQNSDGKVLGIGFINTTTEAKKMNECQVRKIEAEWSRTGETPDVVLPGGITWGTSIEEVESIYGTLEAENIYESDGGYKIYTYKTKVFRAIDLEIYTEDPNGRYQGVSEIEITCHGEE